VPLPPPSKGNACEAVVSREAEILPRDLSEAIELFDHSAVSHEPSVKRSTAIEGFGSEGA
jgi:hypothetical protein